MDFKRSKSGESHLEINSRAEDCDICIDGNKIDVLYAWMLLTVRVSKTVKIPLPELLAQCAFLGHKFEALLQEAEHYSINLSRPVKGGDT